MQIVSNFFKCFFQRTKGEVIIKYMYMYTTALIGLKGYITVTLFVIQNDIYQNYTQPHEENWV